MNDIYKQVEKNIDNLVSEGVSFSLPVTHEQIENYKVTRDCDFMPPPEWIPKNISDMKVLLLAGAGGQQAPLFAAIGADVTVFDLSSEMLKKDRLVAERENLKIRIEKGNMCDLSRFDDNTYDMIVNPPSLFYVPDVLPVYKESHRVLKDNGIFITTFANPVNYMCNYDNEKKAYYVCNPLPFIAHIHDEGCAESGWVEYGHTWDNYLGCLTRSGFAIIDCVEDYSADRPCDAFLCIRAKPIPEHINQ